MPRINGRALRAFVDSVTGKGKSVGAKVQRNPGGSITIKPLRNVAAGFYDEEGIFHPMRASHDYDPSRVGERGRAKSRAKGKRKKARR
jgi:hypothetical protein